MSLYISLSGHETTRRRGVEFTSDQSTGTGRSSARRPSLVHHVPPHETLNSAHVTGSVSADHDPNRLTVVNCLVPANISTAVR